MKSSTKYPYSPSFYDRLFAWMDKNALPTWGNFLFLYLGILLYTQGRAWIEGTTDFGVFEPLTIVNSSWAVFGVAAIKYIYGVAATAAAQFRPLRMHNLAEYETQVYKLVHMPSRIVWLFSLIGPTIALVSYIFDLNIIIFNSRTVVSLFMEILLMWLTFTPIPVFIYHTIRQMNLVAQIQEGVKEIDLFNSTPLYSFSVLTSRTGMVWILLLSSTLTYSIATGGSFGRLSPAFFYFFLTSEIVLATLSFVLPLTNLHQKMEAAKSMIVDEVNTQMKASIQKNKGLIKKLDEGQATAHLHIAQALEVQRNYINKLPTWPWKAETLRGFLSVILLPILLGIIQAIIDRVI